MALIVVAILMELAVDQAKVVYPSWWGDEELHSSHRGNLIRFVNSKIVVYDRVFFG